MTIAGSGGGCSKGDWADEWAQELTAHCTSWREVETKFAEALRKAEKRGMDRASDALTFKKPYGGY